jgi:hypothetical protein
MTRIQMSHPHFRGCRLRCTSRLVRCTSAICGWGGTKSPTGGRGQSSLYPRSGSPSYLAAREAQVAAQQAATAAAEAAASPETADIDTGIVALDAAAALSSRNTAKAAHEKARDIRHTLTDTGLGDGSPPEPE